MGGWVYISPGSQVKNEAQEPNGGSQKCPGHSDSICTYIGHSRAGRAYTVLRIVIHRNNDPGMAWNFMIRQRRAAGVAGKETSCPLIKLFPEALAAPHPPLSQEKELHFPGALSASFLFKVYARGLLGGAGHVTFLHSRCLCQSPVLRLDCAAGQSGKQGALLRLPPPLQRGPMNLAAGI